jgi:small subunit ribosomal protein S13
VARIAGVDLPKNKRAEIGLTYIYGLGHTSAQHILTAAGIDWNKKVSDLTDEEVAKIRSIITADYKVEGALRSEVQMNIKRHRKGLPVRGQRTRTNARSRKGKRKTVAGKKKAAAKK